MISFCLRASEEKLRYAEASSLSAVSMVITGTSASGGRSPRTWSTFAPISERAFVVVVEAQAGLDRRDVLLALRLDVVDAVR